MSFLTEPVTLQSLFGKDRKFGSITVQVVVSETTNDVLTITKQPVQQGTSITDHSFKEPTVFSMQILFSDNVFVSLSKIYQDVLDVQKNRIPIDVITPKRIYKSVLLAAIGMTTDKRTENILSLNLTFQEVIIVKVSTTQVPRANQKQPAVTAATEAAGKKSAIATGVQGIGDFFRGLVR